MKVFIAVGFGGMIGALARHSVSLLVSSTTVFPYATLVVNLIGSFLLSFLLNHPLMKRKLSATILTAITTGVIGSFTTFSTFSVETMQLWATDRVIAIGYVLLSVVFGLAFSFIGYQKACRKQVSK